MSEDFDSWLNKLPKWLQSGASDLLRFKKPPDSAGIVKLADLCLAEETGDPSGFSTVPPNSFSAHSHGATIRLRRIQALNGINALDKTTYLDFGDECMTVVYGHNGTGKSGFARLVKQAANSRTRSTVLSDVFAETVPEKCAEFIIERNGDESPMTWREATGPIPQLRNLQVFDAEVARSYISEEAEVSYEPRRLRFITALVNLCDKVQAELRKRKDALPTIIFGNPPSLAGTELSKFVVGMNAELKVESLKARITRDANHAERTARLKEALQTADPSIRIQAIDTALKIASVASTSVKLFSQALSTDKVREIAKASTNALSLRRIANEAAKAAFEASSLPGVGEGTWRAMWEAAREYSTKVAYPKLSFPHIEDAVCPLCQQSFDEDAANRLRNFEAFVIGEVEAKAKSAEEEYIKLKNGLPKIVPISDWVPRFLSIPKAVPLAESLHSAISNCLTALTNDSIPTDIHLVDFDPILNLLQSHESSLVSEQALLASALKDDQRARLKSELDELLMLDWCHENQGTLIAELERRKKMAVLDGAIKRTNTASLTKKKNELAQVELTSGYQQRFKDELAALGASRLWVKPVEAGKSKGQVKFNLAITNSKRNATPGQVLSEGEARIVALAAFLADVSVAGSQTPFLFDDPISSLDVEFEERVVARLVALAKTRQVLVFTHRLSLFTLLEEAMKKETMASNQVEGAPTMKLKKIILRRLENRIGLVADMNIHEKKVDKGLTDIITTRLPAAKKFSEAGDINSYTDLMKGICSDIRILAERSIEDELLNDVVKRFRRKIITQDRLTSLAKITVSDCGFIDRLMTRFSRYEHSQPEDLPTPLPIYEEVLADATELRDWVKSFRDRQIPESKVALPA